MRREHRAISAQSLSQIQYPDREAKELFTDSHGFHFHRSRNRRTRKQIALRRSFNRESWKCDLTLHLALQEANLHIDCRLSAAFYEAFGLHHGAVNAAHGSDGSKVPALLI